MRAKEYLQQLHKLNIVIEQNKMEIAELKEALTNISSPVMSKDKVIISKSNNGANFEKIITKIDEIENNIINKIELYTSKRNKIINEIQGLKNVLYIQLLYKRYVEFKNLKITAFEMNYAYDYIKVLHSKALKDFEKTYILTFHNAANSVSGSFI